MPIPITVIKKECNFTIVIDICQYKLNDLDSSNAISITKRANIITSNRLKSLLSLQADFIIKPDTLGKEWSDFDACEDLLIEGRKSAEKIMNESSAKIYLSKKMIHSKMLVFDRKIVMSGSANLSIFSMNNAGELNLLIRNSKLVDDFLKIADWRKSVSMKVDKLKTLKSYNKIIAFLQELHQKLKL